MQGVWGKCCWGAPDTGHIVKGPQSLAALTRSRWPPGEMAAGGARTARLPGGPMDTDTFDRLARTLGSLSTRRAGLSLALGAALGLVITDEHDADGKGKSRKKRKKKQAKRKCPDSSTDCGGGVCVPEGDCCPGEKPCGGGCIRARDCCPYTERACLHGGCVAKDACCPTGEQACGTECCGPFEECCNGSCGLLDGNTCTADGWCSPINGWACCDGSVSDCTDSPCCDRAAGEACCVSSIDPVGTTCCPGGAGQCAPGGCCPAGTRWKGDCQACCTDGTTGCSSCRAPVAGRG